MKNRKNPRIRVVRAPGSDRTRLFLYLFLNYLQRIELLRNKIYGSDLELAIISDSIAMAAIEPFMRNPDLDERFLTLKTVVGAEGQRGVNALSIAEATGLPRETTRRKIKKLVEMGIISETSEGEYIFTPGFAQQSEIYALIEQALTDTVQFFNASLEKSFVVAEEA
jgi:predicted transcriptional regulator